MHSGYPRLYVAISLDVEEEGLFGGRYQCFSPSVTNLACLASLAPLLHRGVKPTLFCAYPALTDPAGQDIIRELGESCEIGAHLHYWNTPPLPANSPGILRAVPAGKLGEDEFLAKLRTVAKAVENLTGKPPRSFRMGRWDLHRFMLPLLARCGFICDASVRPLHWHMDNGRGPDHFLAPADPYWIGTPNGKLLEVPLTVLPLLNILKKIPPRFLPCLQQWGALALLAVYHPLWLLRLVTLRHVAAGGRVLSLTWHSSEMMPGGTPHLPDEKSISRFRAKIARYLDWLEAKYDIAYVSMSDLAKIEQFPLRQAATGDWCTEDSHGGS